MLQNAGAFERVIEKAANLPFVLLLQGLVSEGPGPFRCESTNHQLDAPEASGAHAQGIDAHAEKHERSGGIAGHFAAHTHGRALGVGVADNHVDCVENGGMQGVVRRRYPGVRSVCRENVLGEVVRPDGKIIDTGRQGLGQEHGGRHLDHLSCLRFRRRLAFLAGQVYSEGVDRKGIFDSANKGGERFSEFRRDFDLADGLSTVSEHGAGPSTREPQSRATEIVTAGAKVHKAGTSLHCSAQPPARFRYG